MWLSELGVILQRERSPVPFPVPNCNPGQGTCLGCTFGPQLGHLGEATMSLFHIDVSLSYFLFPVLSPKIKIKS